MQSLFFWNTIPVSSVNRIYNRIYRLRTNNLRLGYSYDATISGFEGTAGTHEIGLVYIFDDGDKESRYDDCFQIFR
jgi:hypothetical protein